MSTYNKDLNQGKKRELRPVTEGKKERRKEGKKDICKTKVRSVIKTERKRIKFRSLKEKLVKSTQRFFAP